ncbi:hypothetical protein BGZ81_003636 [Podila clonocystis]|nr:hypothetical protein BGZ81_003636 [Podila clonocystis]
MAGEPFELSADDIEKVFSMNRLSAMGYEFGSGVDIDIINGQTIHTSVANTDTNPVSNMTRYGRSKLCGVLFAKALACRLEKEQVLHECDNPGIVRTEFARNEEAQWDPTFTRVIGMLTGVVFFYTAKTACVAQVYCESVF